MELDWINKYALTLSIYPWRDRKHLSKLGGTPLNPAFYEGYDLRGILR